MRATPLTVAALAAALLLTACDDGGSEDNSKDSKDSAAGSACRIGEMAVRVGPANAAPAAGDTGNVPVTLTNRSGAECTLDGLPAVEFSAGGTSTTVAPDEAAEAKKTTLVKEASTSLTLTYVRGGKGGSKSLAVDTAKIYLPGSTEPHSFPWSYGVVALKSGGGQAPDASVSGFQQSGD
ncbi:MULTISPECIES: DUF4232 domain-containing protein [unclassified Streptomyces]|uniref:DUF4232 domain-containing protein n=1 Tax=unclassified Streptomyces TaxID=2593676 RepID=UPI002365CB5C|nr:MULTISPECIES: DUF4232 domain-containing protein [unclassified Streptomyces]MDF3149044.1 DUF4232 domain-containing protein [Streptomyces sp. T21Q-yed]WDF40227.1 DUF4232 domain-containing protein [Streptomyces sp. T12]